MGEHGDVPSLFPHHLQHESPLILIILMSSQIGRNEYDWCMTSTPQPNAGNKVYSMPRGKVLGGSSAINYLMYVRGSKNC
jgi:choline dehydrogenase-like flavoprotein